MNKLYPFLGMAVFVLLAACASRPELPPRSAVNAAGVDLSGRWVLRGRNGEPQERRISPEERIYVPPASAGRQQQRSGRPPASRPSRGPSVHVFVEHGRDLKITQTDYGLFVSFDRSVVEEYNFGENQLVALGPIEAQRVSGWEGPVYVVETMDAGGVTLTETWSLDSSGSELQRKIEIIDGEEQLYATNQVFDRK